jgi:hypothetical protein
MSFLDDIPEISRRATSEGFLIHGIADGETCVRLWNPWFAHGTMKSAYNHLNPQFCCIHKVTVVDPETSQPTMRRFIWFRAPMKRDFARYAIDYRQHIAELLILAAKLKDEQS